MLYTNIYVLLSVFCGGVGGYIFYFGFKANLKMKALLSIPLIIIAFGFLIVGVPTGYQP